MYCCAIGLSASYKIIEALNCCNKASEQRRIKSVCHQVICKLLRPLSCCKEVLGMVVKLSLVIVLLSKYNVSMPNFILSEYFVDDGCVHLPSVNFSYRQVNHLSRCQRGALFLHYLENSLIFVFAFWHYRNKQIRSWRLTNKEPILLCLTDCASRPNVFQVGLRLLEGWMQPQANTILVTSLSSE